MQWISTSVSTLTHCTRPLKRNNENTPFSKNAGFLSTSQRKAFQKQLKKTLSKVHRLRIEILLLGDLGQSQADICKDLGCSQATARHWLLLGRKGEAHRWNKISMGRPKQVSDAYLKRLQELLENSPREVGYAFQHWTGEWLSKHLSQEFGLKLSARHVNRLRKEMGLSQRRAKPSLFKEFQQ